MVGCRVSDAPSSRQSGEQFQPADLLLLQASCQSDYHTGDAWNPNVSPVQPRYGGLL